MQNSPVTEKKVIGVPEDSYAGARHLATVEEKERWKKKSHKDKDAKVPVFKIGERVVCADRAFRKDGARYYCCIEVIDFVELKFEGFKYYGILRRTTNDKLNDRIGRIITFSESANTWSHTLIPANVAEDAVKWL
jgi:hypothetical protein